MSMSKTTQYLTETLTLLFAVVTSSRLCALCVCVQRGRCAVACDEGGGGGGERGVKQTKAE